MNTDQVLQAVHALYLSNDSAVQRRADSWLTSFRSQPGAWRLCLTLLSQPNLHDYEYYFAAHTLRLACLKLQDVLEPVSLEQTALSVSQLLLAAVAGGARSVAGQLCAALAALAVRGNWDPQTVVLQLVVLLAPQLAVPQAVPAAALAPHAGSALLQVLAALPEACAARQASLHPQRRADLASALRASPLICPLLRMALASGGPPAWAPLGLGLLRSWALELGCLPTGLQHEHQAVNVACQALLLHDTAALAAECIVGISEACGAALGVRSSHGSRAAADGAASSNNAAGGSNTRPKIIGAGGVNKPRPGPGHVELPRPTGAEAGSMSAGDVLGLLGLLLRNLQAADEAACHAPLPAAGALGLGLAAHQRAHAGQGGLVAGGAAADSVVCREPAVAQALCTSLCAAACTMLPLVLLTGSGGGAAVRARMLLGLTQPQALEVAATVIASASELDAGWKWLMQRLMAFLAHPDFEVALTALAFWQDVYLGALLQQHSGGALAAGTSTSGGPGSAAAQQQQAVAQLGPHLSALGALAGAVVARSALSPEEAAVTSADARDLPEGARAVRRELSGTLRDIAGLVGLDQMVAYMAQLTTERYANLDATVQRLRDVAGAACACGCGGAAGPACGCRAALAQQPEYVWCWTQLECALYAANVVLARGVTSNSTDSLHIATVVRTASMAVTHPATHPKLAGTALTLLGGPCPWYCAHPGQLAVPLEAVRASLASLDPKLSRNAATTLNRWVLQPPMARLLLRDYGHWLQGLMELLPPADEPLRHSPAPGVDLTSHELLVASLARLACCVCGPSPSSHSGASLGSGQAGPGPQASSPELQPAALLQPLLAPRVAAARQRLQQLAAATAAVVRGVPGSASGSGDMAMQQQQQQQQLQQLGQLATSAAWAVAALGSALYFLPTVSAVQDAAGSAPPQQQQRAPAGAHGQQGPSGIPADGRSGGAEAMVMCACDGQHEPTAAGAVGSSGGGAGLLSSRAADNGMHAPALATVADLVVDAAQSVWPAMVPCSLLLREGLLRGGSEPPAQLLAAACGLLEAAMKASAAHACAERAQALLQLVLAVLMEVGLGANGSAGGCPPPAVLRLLAACMPACGVALLEPLDAQSSGLPSQRILGTPAAAAGSSSAEASAALGNSLKAAAVAVAQAAGSSLQLAFQSTAARQGLQPDPEVLPAVLQLAEAVLLHVPQLLAGSRQLVEIVCSATAASMVCYDPSLCKALLDWVQLLLGCSAFGWEGALDAGSSASAGPSSMITGEDAGGSSGGSRPPYTGAMARLSARCARQPALRQVYALLAAELDLPCMCAPASAAGHMQAAGSCSMSREGSPACAPCSPGHAHLPHNHGQNRRSSAPASPHAAQPPAVPASLGAALLVSLMGAAAGGMRSDTMLPIASCVHAVWLAGGTPRFCAWLRLCLHELSPPSSGLPWSRLKPEAKAAALAELCCSECYGDLLRFKRALKALAGGKKRGAI